MTTKVSNDIYPLNELREKFSKRIRTTAFSRHPDVFVSFKFFSCLTPQISCIQKIYSETIEKALSGITFCTEKGFHKLNEVDYMFIDSDDIVVAVLKDGTSINVIHDKKSNNENIVKANSPFECRLSIKQLKNYYIKHKLEFPYLNYLTGLLNSMGVENYSNYGQLKLLAARCCKSNWVVENINNCLIELSHLVDCASFVMDYR